MTNEAMNDAWPPIFILRLAKKNLVDAGIL